MNTMASEEPGTAHVSIWPLQQAQLSQPAEESEGQWSVLVGERVKLFPFISAGLLVYKILIET